VTPRRPLCAAGPEVIGWTDWGTQFSIATLAMAGGTERCQLKHPGADGGSGQPRHATDGRAYFDRNKARGKTSNESMRLLKRRLSDIAYRTMVQRRRAAHDDRPGRTPGQRL